MLDEISINAELVLWSETAFVFLGTPTHSQPCAPRGFHPGNCIQCSPSINPVLACKGSNGMGGHPSFRFDGTHRKPWMGIGVAGKLRRRLAGSLPS